MNLVLVESPTKVKSLSRYLGSAYKVMATYGHVRDLPSKQGSVNPDADFALTFDVVDKNKKHLTAIEQAAKKASKLILATDPDREGEAISWHVLERLKEKKIAPETLRITFNAITKKAVLEALENPRSVDQHLVDAYLARLSLDYLVGFTLSPVLWRKLPGCRSAGRVQSVALRILCDREAEIEAFKPQEYWTITGTFQGAEKTFDAKLFSLDGQKLEKFTLNSEIKASEAVKKADATPYTLAEVAKKQVSRNPTAPFMTSTLQQEASRKLGFSAVRTMRVAQQLYEGIEGIQEGMGLITYMRTDSPSMTPEAIQEARQAIQALYGKDFVSKDVRLYTKKARNAQEAHEAIRPTFFNAKPETLAGQLSGDLLALYTLIWRRAMASQMASALFDQLTYTLAHPKETALFRVSGRTCTFKGFLEVYMEGRDDDDVEEGEGFPLPMLNKGDQVPLKKVEPSQHFTEPPPRFSEASLIKKLEEAGIGRPSTYARILQVLKDRLYVTLEKKQLTPSEKGRVLSAFLVHFFAHYVEEGFTAQLEEKLDVVSRGEAKWKDVLHNFWAKFKPTVDEATSLKTVDVLKTIEKDLTHHLFGDAKPVCPSCEKGTLHLRLGKFGPFLGCDSYPDCAFMKPLGKSDEDNAPESEDKEGVQFPKVLGHDSERGVEMVLKKGPYGPYIQWGEGKKPKRVSVPKGMPLESLTDQDALRLGSLPKVVGVHPDTGEDVVGNLGRFGPYVVHQGVFTSVKDLNLILGDHFQEILQLMRAKAESKKTKRSAPKKGKKKT